MTEFWKSNPRKQCDFCKCWIADNRASIEFHERGKNHKENVKRRLAEVKKKAIDKRKADETFSKEFAAMEAAALKAVQKDLMQDPGIVGANDLQVLVKDSNKAQGSSTRNENSAGWIACEAPQGYTYYYNQKTGESQWDKPTELTEEAKKEENKITKEESNSSAATQHHKIEVKKNKHQTEAEETKQHPLLGAWKTVVEEPEKSSYTLERSSNQLEPVATEENRAMEENDGKAEKEKSPTNPESLSTESRKRTAIFKEKQAKSLINAISEEENVGFKKRKIKSNRNARRRDDDDDD